MAGKEGEERETRFVHLLQPYKDLAANWSVDVAQELEEYLSELHIAPLFQDGQSSLNFAEAALLIQGSIQIYSRKVEYLYALVLQALGFLSQSKQSAQEVSSLQPDGKDADVEQEKEEEFLNLDDVPEEANIDLDDERSSNTLNSRVKIPASLLIVEGGDNIDTSGDLGELGGYQIATCSLHRDFLLLDPCDAENVDKYLNAYAANRKERATPARPLSHTRSQKASTPGRRGNSAKKQHASGSKKGPDVCHDVDDAGADTWGEPWGGEARNINFDDPAMAEEGNEAPEYSEAEAADDSDDNIDPWAPLDPHKYGTLLVKPYKPGKIRGIRFKSRHKPASIDEFPLAQMTGVTFPEFKKAWQTRVRDRHKKRPDLTSPLEKLRESFQGFETNIDHEVSDGVFEQEPDDNWNDTYQEQELPERNPCQVQSQSKHPDISASVERKEEFKRLENLCQDQMDSILKKLTEAEHRTELAARVSNWKQKIEQELEQQELHPQFDIHIYGENLLTKLSRTGASPELEKKKTFADLVSGQEKHDVARSFAALLQLVNNGNVIIERGETTTPISHCFTLEDSFKVKLLSSRKVHEEMLHYQAPSCALLRTKVKNCEKPFATELLKEDSSLLGSGNGRGESLSNTSVIRVGQSAANKLGKRWGHSSINVDLENCSPGKGKATPEGKRRRRRQPLQQVSPVGLQN